VSLSSLSTVSRLGVVARGREGFNLVFSGAAAF
jgi:hypothetical protein